MYSLDRIRELPRARVLEIVSVTVLVALVALGMLAITMLGVSSTSWIVILCVVAGLPLLAYAITRSALVWPLALYAALVPFDNILNFSQSSTLTRLLGALCGFSLLCVLLAGRTARTPPMPTVLWAAAICWMGASTMWSVDASWPPETLVSILQLFALYLIISLYPARESDLRALITATLVGGIVAAVYGLDLYLSGSQTIGSRLWLGTAGSKIDPNHFAAALQLPLMIALSWAVQARKMSAKVALSACGLLLAAGMYLTASRGALIAAAVGLIVLAWRGRAYVQLGAVAAFAGALSLAFPTVWYRFVDPTQAGGAGRTSIWQVGLVAARDYWLVGSGIGTFPLSYDRSFLSVYQPITEHWHRVSHNLLVGTLVEIGIVGLALVLAAWLANFRTLSAIPRGSRLHWIAVALESALVALLVESMFLDILTLKYLWLVFILVAITYQSFRADVEAQARLESDPPRVNTPVSR